MKKTILTSLSIIFLGVVYCLFKPINAYKFCLKYSFIDRITKCEQYFASKLNLYQWIDSKDESSLISKMDFQKTLIASSKEEKPRTVIKMLNFSSKSEKELMINDGERSPITFFSETYITPPVYLYEIKDAIIFHGPDTRNFLIFKNGFYTFLGRERNPSIFKTILSNMEKKENIFYDEKERNFYFARHLNKLSKIYDKTIFFYGDPSLYHIIMEPAPGLLLINDNNYKINLAYSSSQNIDIIKTLGDPSIVPTKTFSFEKFGELIIPSTILENNAHFPNIELTNKLIKKLQIAFSKKAKIKSLGKKIYVSRADATRRKILNEVELIKHLENRGFKIVTPGQYNIYDQSKLFEEAEIIIGPHGLGLINMIFSNNLKIVIELFAISHIPNCYLRTAQIKGAKNYYGLIYDPEDSDTWTSNYNINVADVLKILDSLEE